ncbi:MAG: sigma-54-dependent transcriptional regulator [Candidatus Aminicenantia bacterium]
MSKKIKILVVDDEAVMRDTMSDWLEEKGYNVVSVSNGKEAIEKVKTEPFNVAFVDLKMPGLDGIEVLRAIKKINSTTSVIIMTAYATIETAIRAMKEGAYNYLVKPFSLDEVELIVKTIVKYQELVAENILLRQQLEERYSLKNIIGKSQQMKEVLELVENIADSNSTVLIQGASGTGKEVIARLIHLKSRRRNKPFIAANCAAIPRELLESELFGHEKGAFTGATYTKKGRFELANGGTLFLDEVGEMSLNAQIHLLRVLQEKEFRRVGGTELIKIDVRVIASSNRNLEQAVKEGTFREDLFYRLNVIPIYLPKLKERKEDIPLLVEHFLTKYGLESGRGKKSMSPEAMDLMTKYDWPGNVRELENIIERLVILCKDKIIKPKDLPQTIVKESKREYKVFTPNKSLKEIEKQYISDVLKKNNWNISKSAKVLGIERMTLYNKIKKYNLKKVNPRNKNLTVS